MDVLHRNIFIYLKNRNPSRINQKTMRATGSLKLQKGEHGLLNPSIKINKQLIFFNNGLILQYIS